jgi:class 3 adenylate cyclase
MPALPTGTVTFLFTDIERSTAQWEEDPAAMDAGLRIHDEIVRRFAEAHAGYVFSTGGDGFAVAFATAHAALDTAVGVQRALAEEVGTGPVTLRVRMALHTGESNERAGDYFGPPLNRAARLMSAAHGGQIVCSEVTARLLRDRPLRDLGVVALRDLSEPERVFQPMADGLQDDFPPLRSLDLRRHNLPTQPTVLLGRDAELRHIVEMVHAHRLVTLAGAGGCGKTRLAVAAAAEVVDEFGDGVFLVELAPVADPAQVSEVIASTLGLSLAGGAAVGRVARFLANQELLLVVDNCEHLLDEVAAFVDALLRAGSSARVLATSREPLGVEGRATPPSFRSRRS